MDQSEVLIFLLLATIVLLIFIGSLIFFVLYYRRRQLYNENEKTMIHKEHQHELLEVQFQIQQQTMHDIGRDIHDNVGQKLTLASIYANQLIANKDSGDERIISIRSIINESLAELRALSKSLVSTETNSEDLHATLRYECDRVNALKICEVTLSVAEDRFTISASVKNFIVRIVQEFLQNSLKHSGCSAIRVKLEFNEQELMLSCTDNGTGFDPGQEATGIGLENMRSRAALIGAALAIESTVGRGTTMRLNIPLDKISIQ